jgi:2-oxoglutarate dehydrogenase E2 component (dihydrolipoamide succinyltransferase)
MTGGTFTITNGGVFWSMLSTIINPPQSAILGMHNIERPIAVSGKVEIHPMMYVAYLTTIGLLMRNLLVF